MNADYILRKYKAFAKKPHAVDLIYYILVPHNFFEFFWYVSTNHFISIPICAAFKLRAFKLHAIFENDMQSRIYSAKLIFLLETIFYKIKLKRYIFKKKENEKICWLKKKETFFNVLKFVIKIELETKLSWVDCCAAVVSNVFQKQLIPSHLGVTLLAWGSDLQPADYRDDV